MLCREPLHGARGGNSFWAAVFGGGVLAGIGVVIGGALPVQTSTMRWFVRRRALAFAIILSAGGIGGVFAPPLLNYAIASTGDWRTGWWIFAGLVGLSAVVAAFLFARDQPSDLGAASGWHRAPHWPRRRPRGSARRARTVHHTDEPWTAARGHALPDAVAAARLHVRDEHGLHVVPLPRRRSSPGSRPQQGGSAAFTASSMAATTLLGKFAVGAARGSHRAALPVRPAPSRLFGLGILLIVNARDSATLYTFGLLPGRGVGRGAHLPDDDPRELLRLTGVPGGRG